MTHDANEIGIYHIVHVDKLQSILDDGFLWSDCEVRARGCGGTTVGMSSIKDARLARDVSSHPGLVVGACVPFYFCPRSVMLYLLHRGNHPGVTYTGGQEPIIHLYARLGPSVTWAETNQLRWAFTLSNAGSSYFEDRSNLAELDEIDWSAVKSNVWGGASNSAVKEGKQAEFLLERCFAWGLVAGIGVKSKRIGDEVTRLLAGRAHRPQVKIKQGWYY